MQREDNITNSLKLSVIEHNPSALKGYFNNPKWYAYGHRLKTNDVKLTYCEKIYNHFINIQFGDNHG